MNDSLFCFHWNEWNEHGQNVRIAVVLLVWAIKEQFRKTSRKCDIFHVFLNFSGGIWEVIVWNTAEPRIPIIYFLLRVKNTLPIAEACSVLWDL